VKTKLAAKLKHSSCSYILEYISNPTATGLCTRVFAGTVREAVLRGTDATFSGSNVNTASCSAIPVVGVSFQRVAEIAAFVGKRMYDVLQTIVVCVVRVVRAVGVV